MTWFDIIFPLVTKELLWKLLVVTFPAEKLAQGYPRNMYRTTKNFAQKDYNIDFEGIWNLILFSKHEKKFNFQFPLLKIFEYLSIVFSIDSEHIRFYFDSGSSKAHWKLSQTSKMKLFAKIIHGFQPLIIFAKYFILDVLSGFWIRLCSC